MAGEAGNSPCPGGRWGGPPGVLPALEEVSEESLEEAGAGGDPRVPPTLLQLLEDSIEC